MSTEIRTVFYRLTIMSDPDGKPAVVMHETKSARFFGDEQLTPWQPDEPSDLPLPLSSELLGEINAAAVAEIDRLTAAHAETLARIRSEHAAEIAALKTDG